MTGLPSQDSQPPADTTFSSYQMYLQNFEASTFSQGSSITFFLSSARRPVTIGCGASGSTTGDCAWHDMDGIKTLKFGPSDSLLHTTVNGTRSTTCGGTVSYHGGTFSMPTGTPPSCDWIMRDDGVVNLEVAQSAPAAVTLGYLGKTTAAIRGAVSITPAANTSTEILYDAEQHELALFFEPITGQAMKGFERLQSNFYVEASMLDSIRYANVFTTTTKFVWPYMFIQRTVKIEDDDAQTFKGSIYLMYRLGFALDVAGVVLCPLLLVCGCILLCSRAKDTSPPGEFSPHMRMDRL